MIRDSMHLLKKTIKKIFYVCSIDIENVIQQYCPEFFLKKNKKRKRKSETKYC